MSSWLENDFTTKLRTWKAKLGFSVEWDLCLFKSSRCSAYLWSLWSTSTQSGWGSSEMYSLGCLKSPSCVTKMKSTNLTHVSTRKPLRTRYSRILKCWCSRLLTGSMFVCSLMVKLALVKLTRSREHQSSQVLCLTLLKNFSDWGRKCQITIWSLLSATWLNYTWINYMTFYSQVLMKNQKN